MLIAMTLAAALCIGIGVFPGALYSILPMATSYEPYTASHVLAQLQLLIFSALAFSWLMRNGVYPPELRSVNLDSDWLYRGLGLRVTVVFDSACQSISAAIADCVSTAGRVGAAAIERLHGRRGVFAVTSASGSMAISIMVMLLAFLLSYYLA
jgi:multicomponent Na+:H+ antiporter subunit D